MLNLKCAELFVGFITFFIAYLTAISIAGFFKAWIAYQAGDETPRDMGFLTLNPLVHIDTVGAIFLILFRFGWSRSVPINPHHIDGSIKMLGIKSGARIPKLVFTYLADTIAYFTIALIALVAVVAIFGTDILDIAYAMLVFSQCMSHLFIAHAFPTYSSMSIAIGFILIALAYLSIMVGVLDFILNSYRLALQLFIEKSPDYTGSQEAYSSLLIPIVIMLIFAAPLRFFVTSFMVYEGGVIARLLGVS